VHGVDRFNSILNLTVVLADGRCVQTGFAGFPDAKAANVYRHGIGPSVDGLFTQSNFGIVTKMTLALQPKPQFETMFVHMNQRDDALEEIVNIVRRLRLEGVVNSTVHIANNARLRKSDQSNSAGCWNLSGSVSGPKPITAAKRKVVTRYLNALTGGRTIWVTDFRLKLLGAIHRRIISLPFFEALVNAMGLKRGVPAEAYIQDFMQDPKACSSDMRLALNPNRFIWISVVCPAQADTVRDMVSLVSNFLSARGYPFRATLSFINPRALILITELNYLNKEHCIRKAQLDYAECVNLLKGRGFYAYRSGPQEYQHVLPEDSALLDLCRSIKKTLDPNRVFSPGKYGL